MGALRSEQFGKNRSVSLHWSGRNGIGDGPEMTEIGLGPIILASALE